MNDYFSLVGGMLFGVLAAVFWDSFRAEREVEREKVRKYRDRVIALEQRVADIERHLRET